MDEAAVPTGPTGRNILVQGLESAKIGDREFQRCAPGGAALRAAPPARRAATEEVPVFRRFQSLDKDVSPCGA
eukprot:3047047-Alexandrium_andersonii.AAC.1